MVLFKRAAMLIATCSMMLVGVASAAIRAVERIAILAFALFAPAPARLAADGYTFERRADRAPLAASLLEGLRHEKGVPRLGAARGC